MIFSFVLIISGCAKSTSDLATTYVSPVQYQNLSCDQLTAEMSRVSSRVSQLGSQLNEASSNDTAITAVGIVLFWPILFALGGTDQQEAEYSRLKGEYDALNQSIIQKNCFEQQSQNINTTTNTSTKPNFTNNSRGSANSNTKLSISQAVEKCNSFGLASGTEKFGDCVLSLSK